MRDARIKVGMWMLLLSLSMIVAAQSYSPMYAPQSSHNLTYVCVDQYNNPIPYAYIIAYSGSYLFTNSHFHYIPVPPVTSVTPYGQYTDSTGAFTITLATTLVGRAEALFLECSYGGATVYVSANYAVGYSDLYYNHHPEIWVTIGGDDTGGGTLHGSTDYNRYMRSGLAYGLYYATQSYLAAHSGVSRICTNDMALPFGGKFDINRTWSSPHSQHDRGTAADVAATGTAQCANAGGEGVDIVDFRARCIANGALTTYSFLEGNHVHCGWEAPTWPH